MLRARVGVFPGSFNPPTVAHLAVARAALEQGGLDRVDLAVSDSALGKETAGGPSAADREELLHRVAAGRPWLGTLRTPHQLVADIADGYDAVVMGADKWAQVRDPAWYGGSVEARDAAVSRLPAVLVAPRHGHPLSAAEVAPGLLLRLPTHHREVSSSAVRAGRRDWIAAEAADLEWWE